MKLLFLFTILSAINIVIFAILLNKMKMLRQELKNINLINDKIKRIESRIKLLREKGLL